MNANSHSTARARAAEQEVAATILPAAQPPAPRQIDLRAALRSSYACCCSARPGVVVIMPPAPSRAHQTDLLLCWHHYRASRPALAAAGATVLTMAGTPESGDGWQPQPAST